MANHKSAIKRIRQTERKTARNKAAKSQLRTRLKKFSTAIAGEGGADASELLKPTLSLLDRSVSKGVLHRNKADRLKSRLAKAANQAAAEPKPAEAS